MLGYTRREIKELFDDKFSNMIHPEDRKKLFDGEENHSANRDPDKKYEYRIKAKNGYIWVIDQTSYMADMEPPCFQGVIMDVTERHMLREQLKASNKAFRIAAKEAGNLVFTYNRREQTVYCDSTIAEEFGVEEIQTGVPYDIIKRGGIVSEDTVSEYLRIHEEILGGAKEAGGIVDLISADGEEKVYELRFQTILDEADEPTDLAVGVYKDITKPFLQARAQEENLKTLMEEYTSVKEQMKNESMEIMAIIYALGMEYYSLWLLDLKQDILLMRRNDNKFMDRVDSEPHCFSEAIALYAEKWVHPNDNKRFIEEMSVTNIRKRLEAEKSFYVRIRRRSEDGEYKNLSSQEEKECNLSERIHNLVHMIRPQMRAKQLEFFVDTIDVQDEDLIFDPLKLDQVLINILGNAVKFTPPGGDSVLYYPSEQIGQAGLLSL